jgi:hypothetical protein
MELSDPYTMLDSPFLLHQIQNQTLINFAHLAALTLLIKILTRHAYLAAKLL